MNAQNTVLHIVYSSKPNAHKSFLFEAMELRISRLHHFNLYYIWCIHG